MASFNRFWRNTRTEKHRPDDPLNTEPPTPPSPPPAPRRGCTCEFCGCTLAPSGEVLKRGDEAKRFMQHDNVLENKDKEIARLNTEVADLKAKLAAASQAPGPAARRGVGRLID